MNQLPLVSVICLCHNQSAFVGEAIQSVCRQSYPNIELIVVDDGSTDGSKDVIKSIIQNKKIPYIDISTPVGNCTAFNRGFFESKGEFIIDLAADDILLPERILSGINAFMNSNAGVNFCDVMFINDNGKELRTHYERSKSGQIAEHIPEGDIYVDLIKRYFISAPSMMIKRSVLEQLGGYDETLTYEDFDFWIRSSRNWKYTFTDDVLVKKRIVPGSLSDMQFRRRSKHQISTLHVCQKIKKLNQTEEERSALRKRCFYEVKQCIRQANLSLIPKFLKLL